MQMRIADSFRNPPTLGEVTKPLLLLLLAWIMVPVQASPRSDISVTQENGVPLYLHALAPYEQYGELLYMGAIYMPMSATDLIEHNSRRLEMRINSTSLNAGRFNRLWLDAIALNSSQESRRRLQRQIGIFSGLYHRELHPGDRLAFDYIAAEARTVFYHNDRQVGSIGGRDMFELLLSAWIGDNPQSEKMKTSLIDCVKKSIPTSAVRSFRLIPYESKPENTLRPALPG